MGCFENLQKCLRKNGATVLVIMTVLQAICFVTYSLFYLSVFKKYNPTDFTDDKIKNRTILYWWVSIVILLLGMCYFLFSATYGRNKNPNELISYLTIAVVLNLLFIYKLSR
jgi:heme/copper-type cytochrome/quinol oxidase subunit 3